MIFSSIGFDLHPPACSGAVSYSVVQPAANQSCTCSFFALLSDLFLCHTSPNSTPAFGLVLTYTLKYPCLHIHVYIKAGGQGMGNLLDDLASQSQPESITSPMFLKITGAHFTSK